MTPEKSPPPLGLGLKLSYGFGSTAFGAGGAALSTAILQLYFNQVIGLPAVWVGAAIMATVMIDALIDPLIGRFSDRLRSPLGRRHTLMYLAALPAALGFYFMWHAPGGLPPLGLLAFMIAMLVFVNVSISLYEIPSLALAPELAPDYDQRTSLIGFRWMFLIFGGAAMNFVLYQVFLRQDEANPLGVLNRDRYADFGLTAAIVIFVAILVSTAATHRRIKHLHVPPVRKVSWRDGLAEIRQALSHRPLVMMMLVGLFMGFGAGTTFGLSAYFNLHFWGLKPQQISFLVVCGLVASPIALWAAPRLGARFGKKPAMLALYLGWLVTAVGPLSLGLLGLMPAYGSNQLLAVLMGNYTVSLFLALCCHMLLGSSIADTIDDIAVRTGARSEGMLFAGYSVLDKFSNGGGAFVAGAIVSAAAFPTSAVPGTVDPQILRNMVLTNLPIVVLFNLASIFCLSRYSLTRADHERNAAILAQRRAEESGPPGLVPRSAAAASLGPEGAV
jgi:glycoside/pentoside/hexuronide:cation symporter, GPH family